MSSKRSYHVKFAQCLHRFSGAATGAPATAMTLLSPPWSFGRKLVPAWSKIQVPGPRHQLSLLQTSKASKLSHLLPIFIPLSNTKLSSHHHHHHHHQHHNYHYQHHHQTLPSISTFYNTQLNDRRDDALLHLGMPRSECFISTPLSAIF